MIAEELFGRRVQAARKAARLTLKEAAKKLGITFDHLSKIENGSARASFELIIEMANVFGVPVMSFFIFEGAETDEKTLRRKIDGLLNKYSANQLAQVYRYLIFVVGP
jgi:transcriptional regulator with XRE-family HTH domain